MWYMRTMCSKGHCRKVEMALTTALKESNKVIWHVTNIVLVERCCTLHTAQALIRRFVFTWQLAALFLRELTSWMPSWKCDVKSKIRLRQSIHIYVRNNPVKFHPDPIWNDGALGFFWRGHEQKSTTKGDRWVKSVSWAYIEWNPEWQACLYH